MIARDLQTAFLTVRLNRKYFRNVFPQASSGFFFTYDQLSQEWEKKLRESNTLYMIVFIEDIKLKLIGQEHLPLKPDFINRLVKDRRLGHVVFTLDSGGFSGLPTLNDKELDDQMFLRYWQIAPSSNCHSYVGDQELKYRSEFMDWL